MSLKPKRQAFSMSSDRFAYRKCTESPNKSGYVKSVALFELCRFAYHANAPTTPNRDVVPRCCVVEGIAVTHELRQQVT